MDFGKFGIILRKLRKERGIGQIELARYLNVTRSAISGYETMRRRPQYEIIIKLADYFGVSVDYLLTGKDAVIQTE